MKLKKLLKLGALLLFIPTVASCSFVRKDTPLGIDNITHEEDEFGNIVVTITYTDETSYSFTIPMGKTGKDGNGIDYIDSSIDPTTGAATITIHYTDTSETDTFSVPSSKGIKEIYQELDSSGNTVITFLFSDDTLSDPIVVYKGSTGNGIDSIVPTYNDDGSIDVVITTTDSVETTVSIPAPNEGNGISSVVSGQTEDQYYLTIYYTEEGRNPDTVYFDIPVVSKWETVYEKPKDSEGKDGDFAFDIDKDVIYGKINGTWVVVVDFNTDDTIYTVTFDLNASDATRVGGDSQYQIPSGQTFYSTHKTLPLAVRPNYTFGGWSTSSNHNVTNGLFTDLTPVLCDTILFAVWIPE